VVAAPPRPEPAPQGLAEEKPARRTGLILLLVGVALLLLAAIGYQVAFASSGASRPASAVLDIAGKELVVDSEPSGAEVTAGEQKLGKTPLQVENPFPLGKKVLINVRLPGGGAVDIPIAGGRGQHVTARLAVAPAP
jgi:hypothetical protein